jgi:hypothetical protein
MKLVAASAFLLATLLSVGGASACDEWFQAMAALQAEQAQKLAATEVKQMVANYLDELTEEHRIA